jgi:hypothetical protein
MTPAPDDLEKVAEAKGISIKVAQLAKAYFEQLQLDKIPYESEEQRAADAMKMAEGYYTHVEDNEKEAASTADSITRFLKHAAEGFLAQNNIALSADEAIKIAALDIESEEKIASFNGDNLSNTPLHDIKDQDFKKIVPGGPDGLHAVLMNHGIVGRKATKAELMMHGHNLAKLKGSLGNVSDHTLFTTYAASLGDKPGFFSKNKNWLIGGALGAGALYLLHKANKKREEEDERRRMDTARMAASLPPL